MNEEENEEDKHIMLVFLVLFFLIFIFLPNILVFVFIFIFAFAFLNGIKDRFLKYKFRKPIFALHLFMDLCLNGEWWCCYWGTGGTRAVGHGTWDVEMLMVLMTVSGSVNSIESKWKEPYFRNWWKRSTKKYFYPYIHLWYNNVVPNDYFISDCGCSGAYEMRENFKWKYPYMWYVCVLNPTS